MAKINKLTIVNSADKSYKYAVATGFGAIADADDPIVADVVRFPAGSLYSDFTNKNFYVRLAATGVVGDWVLQNPDTPPAGPMIVKGDFEDGNFTPIAGQPSVADAIAAFRAGRVVVLDANEGGAVNVSEMVTNVDCDINELYTPSYSWN